MSLHEFLLTYVSCGHQLIESNPQTFVLLIHCPKHTLTLVKDTESMLQIMHFYVSVALGEQDLRVAPKIVHLILFIIVFFFLRDTFLQQLRCSS